MRQADRRIASEEGDLGTNLRGTEAPTARPSPRLPAGKESLWTMPGAQAAHDIRRERITA